MDGAERQNLGTRIAVGGMLVVGGEDGRTQRACGLRIPSERLQIQQRSSTENGAFCLEYIRVEDAYRHAFRLSERLRIQV